MVILMVYVCVTVSPELWLQLPLLLTTTIGLVCMWSTTGCFEHQRSGILTHMSTRSWRGLAMSDGWIVVYSLPHPFALLVWSHGRMTATIVWLKVALHVHQFPINLAAFSHAYTTTRPIIKVIILVVTVHVFRCSGRLVSGGSLISWSSLHTSMLSTASRGLAGLFLRAANGLS